MKPLHWWQWCLTPAKSANAFKEDCEPVIPFFVRLEVGDSTLTKSETPRATSADPFRKEIDDCTRSLNPERMTAFTPLTEPTYSLKTPSELGNIFPLGSSRPFVKSKNPFCRESNLCTFKKSTDQENAKSKSRSNCRMIKITNNL